MGNVLINEKYPDGIFHGASEFKRALVKDKLVWFSDYNIVTREKKALYLYDNNGNLLESTGEINCLHVSYNGVGSIFALCDFTDHLELRVFDLSLNQITSYNISDAGGTTNAVFVKIISVGNRVLFVCPNTVGGKERRLGFFDFGVSNEIHWIPVTISGSACLVNNIWYNIEKDAFYTHKGVTLWKLDEQLYDFIPENEPGYPSANPCTYNWDRPFNVGSYGELTENVWSTFIPTSGVGYVQYRNGDEPPIIYKDNSNINFYNAVQLNDRSILAILKGNNNSLFFKKITDFFTANVGDATYAGIVISDGGVLFPMYKHPYKDIVAIPAKNGDTFTVYLKYGNTFADIGNFSPQTIPVGFMEFGFEFIPKN